MPDRRPIPLLIMLILVVLTISAVVSGLLLAPKSADLTVQNAAGENLLASSLTVHIVATQTNIVGTQKQTLPPATQNVTFDPSVSPNPQTQSGVDAKVVLNLLNHMTKSSPWSAGPTSYRYTGSISALFGIPAEASENGLVVRVTAKGTAEAWVSGGYLAAVFTRFDLTAGPVTERVTELMEFHKIGDYTPDLSQVHT